MQQQAGIRPVELWAMEEHRVGLKPVLRRVWAKRGCRRIAPVRPRYEWLYIYAFVYPETGETEFWLAPSVNTEAFTAILSAFLRGRSAPVMLVLDRAGWHVSAPVLAMQEDHDVDLCHLPPYSPELMLAERLWTLTDEPIANRVFDRLADLDAALGERCVALTEQRDLIRRHTLYHWWPGGASRSSTA